MAIFSDLVSYVSSITASLTALDLKLDEVKAKIDSLSTGSVITQEQIDALAASLDAAKEEAAKSLDAAKEEAAKVLSEGSSLVDPAVPVNPVDLGTPPTP